MTMKPEVPNPEMEGARQRLSRALLRQSELATASVADPALEVDYQRAVADVAAAEAALVELPKQETNR
jgi:hypothetical protein